MWVMTLQQIVVKMLAGIFDMSLLHILNMIQNMDIKFNNTDLTDYKFDVMGEAIGIDYQVDHEGDLDEGGIVVFRLLHPSKPPLYLHLYNCHNGYYGHEVLTNIPNKSICL